jgi:hypothetical protein
LIKPKALRTEVEKAYLDKTIEVICDKVRYDTDYDFNHEGEDEILFQEYR